MRMQEGAWDSGLSSATECRNEWLKFLLVIHTIMQIGGRRAFRQFDTEGKETAVVARRLRVIFLRHV